MTRRELPNGPLHDLAVNDQGRFYHINCGPGDLAPYVLTCGDPGRAQRLARLLDRVQDRRRYREFHTVTGEYRRIPVSVAAASMITSSQFTKGIRLVDWSCHGR